MTYNILVADDDFIQRKLISEIVANHLGYNAILAEDGSEAVDVIVSQKGRELDLVIMDVQMPRMNGLEALKLVRPQFPDLPIVMLSGNGDVNMAVQCVKMGATDFILKNPTADRLKVSIENCMKLHVLQEEVSRLKRSVAGQVFFSDILGTSQSLLQAIDLGRRAATSSIPVFIEGENGVGKELFARAIHGCSTRAEKPFLAINCGAIPDNLAESVLFGHEKGAFTGAIYKSLGKFREANGGTIFLDEVGELKPELQVKLLRILQEGEIEPVGGKPVKIDVRIISATNRNIDELVEKNKFREDLYYRLKVFPITVPPLRNRKDDIGMLLDYFCRKFSVTEAKKILGITDYAKGMLENYYWPGNIRELQNVIFRAVILCDKEYIDTEDFSMLKKFLPSDSAPSGQPQPLQLVSGGGTNGAAAYLEQSGDFRKMADIEAEVIKSALEHYNWHISEVARRLGIGRSTLYRKMEELNIAVQKANRVA